MAEWDSQDLSFWLAYFSVRPFGNVREDMRMARVCMVMASLWTAKGRRPEEAEFMFFRSDARDRDRELEAKCYLLHLQLIRVGRRGK